MLEYFFVMFLFPIEFVFPNEHAFFNNIFTNENMKFTTFSSLIPFSLFSLLNISKASSSISFTLTEKEHTESRMFAHADPGKFLNAEQKFESPSQIELHSYK